MTIENISVWIAQGDKQKSEIYSYLIRSRLITLITIGLSVGIAYYFEIVLWVLIIGFTASFLRGYTGGVHSQSVKICSIISILVTNGLGLLVKHLEPGISTSFLMFYFVVTSLAGYYLIYKHAPIDSIKRPIRNPEFRKKIKKRAFIFFTMLLTIFAISTIFTMKGIAMSIILGLSWQQFTMSKAGFWTFAKLDNLFNAGG